MNTEINNQHTLYRFVSLRNPELSNIEKQERRFVFYFENDQVQKIKGFFYKAIQENNGSQTKWQVLTSKASDFSANAFTSDKDVENINTDFYIVANWLAKNRKTTQPEELLKRVNGLVVLDPSVELVLWDNLFYTIITDKNYYIKEAIIQMLVLQNVLKQKAKFENDQETLENIIPLSNAVVVLPVEIFEEDTVVNSNNSSASGKELGINLIPKSLIDSHEIEKAKNEISLLQNIKEEISTIEKSQKEDSLNQQAIAYNNYQNQVKPIIDRYQNDYNAEKFRLETLAQTNKDINTNLINIPYPDVPNFEFSIKEEINKELLLGKLSPFSREKLSEYFSIEDSTTYSNLYTAIDNNIASMNKTIVEKTVFSTQNISFGDVVLSTAKTTSEKLRYQICSQQVGVNNYKITLTIYQSCNVESMSYKFILQDGTFSPLYTSYNNNTNSVLVVNGLFGPNGFIQNPNNPVTGITMEFKLSDGCFYTIDNNNFILTKWNCSDGFLNQANGGITETDVAPKGFGFRQIGIADYKKVVTEICGYRAGEVAHIENIMAGETREKVTTKTHISEVTDVQSQEIETEKLSDTTSTERFEMQTEIAKMQQEQTALDTHVNVHTGGTGWTLDAGANYATNTTKEESNRQAVTQAKELTQRAMERIVSRIKTSKTVKITDEFVESNKHRFENLTNPSNVSGVYRFVNAVYKNQIFNYGKRMMYEFMIPQPSKLHRLGLAVSTADTNATLLTKPIDPRDTAFNDFSTIDEINYKTLIAKYDATDVKPYPDPIIYINKTFSGGTGLNGDSNSTKQGQSISENFDLPIKEGYETLHAKINVGHHWDTTNGFYNSFGFNVGNIKVTFCPQLLFIDTELGTIDINDTSKYYSLDKFRNTISLSCQALNNVGYFIAISIKCQLTQEAIQTWKKETYEAIIKGYETQLEAYNEQIASIKAEGVKLLDSNPLFYRDIENLILRKNCISYLIDQSNTNSARRFGLKMYNEGMSDSDVTFINHQVTLTQTMDDYTSFAKFMEQAFEWNLMSYNFYPFYWGNNAEWKDLYQFETNDPTYRSFMQAGMARVIVTVKPGFENAVMHYMAFGQIWNGGQTPILGNPLYLSIVDELKEQEYYIEDVWETVVPTNLVALQESGVSIAGGGLPNADSCVEHKDVSLLLNDKTLGVVLPK